MPIDLGSRAKPLGITGSLRIECGDFHFKLKLTPEHFAADFPSFGMLLRAKRMGEEFGEMIADIPAPPSFPAPKGESKPFLAEKSLYATVNDRPVGKLLLKEGTVTFRPTPLSFLFKLR